MQPAPDVQASLPVPADTERVRVLLMGDQGKGTPEQLATARAMQEVCAAQGCDFGVALGDNFYPKGPKEATSPLFQKLFADVYGPLKLPFFIVTGNHDQSWLFAGDGADARGADAEVAYAKLNPQWIMPARTYRAQAGQLAEFLVLDTTPLAAYLPPIRANERPGGPWDAAQRAWLSDTLKQSGAKWKLVLGHHPLFSNGKHGDAGQYDRLPFAFQRGGAVRDLYSLACGQADLILSGHDHALALFGPQPECQNTWQVVSGAAGEPEGARRGQRPAVYEAYGQLGFAWLDITPDTLTVRFYVLDQGGKAALAFEQQLKK